MVDCALVRSVSWNQDEVALSLLTDDAAARVPLAPGQWLRFEVLSGDGISSRYCLGHTSVQGPLESVHFPCPSGQVAERGFQCGTCFAKDEMRFMHDFHRSGVAPAGMRNYLAQPHWLYIATFADGTTKVGTAAMPSKWRRLAEQGAVTAQYVALAEDGAVVRRLEDSVTKELGVSQFVRAAAKLAALCAPRSTSELLERNLRVATAVREFLAEGDLDGFETVNEEWQGSSFSAELTGSRPRIAYPRSLHSGTHGMRLESMLGSHALVTVDGSELSFVADLGALKGHKISFGDYTTEVPALQEALF